MFHNCPNMRAAHARAQARRTFVARCVLVVDHAEDFVALLVPVQSTRQKNAQTEKMLEKGAEPVGKKERDINPNPVPTTASLSAHQPVTPLTHTPAHHTVNTATTQAFLLNSITFDRSIIPHAYTHAQLPTHPLTNARTHSLTHLSVPIRARLRSSLSENGKTPRCAATRCIACG